MKKTFVKPSYPALSQESEQIDVHEIQSLKTQELINQMLNVAFPQREDKSKAVLVGLSAPQIGISKAIILVDIGADGKAGTSDLRPFINPEITWSSQSRSEGYEGCRSTDKVCGIVERADSVRVRAYDRDGRLDETEFTGFVARIFQHEIDHLKGILFPDLITDPNKLHWVEPEQFPEYRKNWQNWPVRCPREKWIKIKSLN